MKKYGQESWVLGPPGTGKTRYLSKQSRVASNGNDRLMIASFTRAAASEIAARTPHIDSNDVGTLHSFAYRALGRPTIAETRVNEFNEMNNAGIRLDDPRADMDDGSIVPVGRNPADDHYLEYQRLRALMRPPETWPQPVAFVGDAWKRWKRETGYVDFTDMIQITLEEEVHPSADYSIGFFDEAQDFTPLEIALIRMWSKRMRHIVLAGDDDQAIYAFKGGDPSAVFPLAHKPDNIRVLSQSHRLPRSVFNIANEWIRLIPERHEKEYRPTDNEGRVESESSTWQQPERIVRMIEEYGYGETDETFMILTSCSYMLDPLVKLLRDAGVRFHNPYSPKNGKWNPLRKGRGTSAVDRLRAYLNPTGETWTWGQLMAWVPDIDADVLRRGMKKRVAESPDFIHDVVLDRYELETVFQPGVLGDSEFGTPQWFQRHLLSSKGKKYDYPLRVNERGGLGKEPKIVVGTIHSVKGGEADHVMLFPDLSSAGFAEWTSSDKRERVIRQFYVGMTRARCVLSIGRPAYQSHVPLTAP